MYLAKTQRFSDRPIVFYIILNSGRDS